MTGQETSDKTSHVSEMESGLVFDVNCSLSA